MFEARPQPAEATAKIPTPTTKIRRRPNRSPSEPPTRINAPRNRPYDSTTHCTSTTVALKLACIAGRATFTTVLSMNAMLEPRIVAARTHGFALSSHPPPRLPDRKVTTSQGVLIETMDAIPGGLAQNIARPMPGRIAIGDSTESLIRRTRHPVRDSQK